MRTPIFERGINKMEEFRIESSIKKIAIKNDDNEVVTVLKIDVADSNTAIRFANLINNLENISKDSEKKIKGLNEIESEYEKTVLYARERVKCLENIINELDSVFGEKTVRNVFKESYELKEDFMPDEYALSEFIDGIIPIMNNLFNERFEKNKKKYNSARGKHNKTKDDLIREYKNV